MAISLTLMRNLSLSKKLFLQLILIFGVIFLIQSVIISSIFPIYYLNNKETSIEKKLTYFINNFDEDNLENQLFLLSEATQTNTKVFPYPNSVENLFAPNFYQLTITTPSGDDYTILSSSFHSHHYTLNTVANATIFQLRDSELYVPSQLLIGTHRIISHRERAEITELLGVRVMVSTKQIISGTITNIQEPTIGESELLPVITNELLNLVTQNIDEVDQIDIGYKYISFDEVGNKENIVFLSEITINNQNHLMLSVYNLSQIDEVTSSIQSIILYVFIFAFILSIGLTYLFSKSISAPLVSINQTTKKLSNLDFGVGRLPIQSNDEIGQLSQSINIMTENLKNALTQLELQNAQLADSINQENKNDEMRKEFLAGMSHELKTPLAIILASSEAIQNGVYTSEKDVANQLDIIKKEVIKSTKLIGEMVQIYNVDQSSSHQNYTDVNLKSIILETHNSLKHLAELKHLVVNIDLKDAVAKCEESKMKLVFSNLYSNAIKYAKEDSTITIHLEEKKDEYIFMIKNLSDSISIDQLSRLSEPFYKVETSRNRLDGSTGLGLYIVTQILVQHDFKYNIEYIGSEFVFTIKIKKSF